METDDKYAKQVNMTANFIVEILWFCARVHGHEEEEFTINVINELKRRVDLICG